MERSPYVGPLVGEDTRTAKARVVLSQIRTANGVQDSSPRWSSCGTILRLPLVVRNEAIQTFQNKSVVFVQYDDQYEARPVTLGRSDDTFTEVLKGLSAVRALRNREQLRPESRDGQSRDVPRTLGHRIMIGEILKFSIQQRWIMLSLTLIMAGLGVYNVTRLNIDAVPDITNIQVQVSAQARDCQPWRSSRGSRFRLKQAWQGFLVW